MQISISLDPAMGKNMPKYLAEVNAIRGITVHCDVMDGVFVPRKNMEKSDFDYILLLSSHPTDVHLMTADPEPWIKSMKEKSAASVCFHVESAPTQQHVRKLLRRIKGKQMKAGIAIDLGTDITQNILELLSECDIITIMSVKAGLSGQSFNPAALEKIKQIKNAAPNIRVILDGGVNAENLSQVKAAGVDTAVVGNAVYSAENRLKAVQNLQNICRP